MVSRIPTAPSSSSGPHNYNLIALPLAGVYTLENFSLWAMPYPCNTSSCNPVDYTGTFH